MLTIDNLATSDDYTRELTMESPFGGRIVYVVANQSARVQFKPKPAQPQARLADWFPAEGFLLTPASSFIDKIGGMRFKSAVAGSPARIVAQMAEPGDILPASGTPFTQTLFASGEAANVPISADGGQGSANVTLAVAAAVMPGTLLNFTITGSQAKILVIGSFDIVIDVAGTAICAGGCLLDGGALGGEALWGESAVNVRGNCAMTWAQSVGVGAHTVQLYARKSLAAGNAQLIGANTRISLLVVDQQ